MADTTISQLNIRMPADLKERGNATLALVGSSPARIIRKLWEKISEGGEAYEAVTRVLDGGAGATASSLGQEESLERALCLFEDLGATLGLDLASFEPDARPMAEILEEIEWEQLAERGLA